MAIYSILINKTFKLYILWRIKLACVVREGIPSWYCDGDQINFMYRYNQNP